MAIHAFTPGTMSISVPTYADLGDYGDDCLLQIAPGIYQHARLGTTFVVLNRLTSQATRVGTDRHLRPPIPVRRPIPVTPIA